MRIAALSNGGAVAVRHQLGDARLRGVGKIRRDELGPADRTGRQLVARVADHVRVRVVGLEHATVDVRDQDAEDPRLGEAREPRLARAQRLGRPAPLRDVAQVRDVRAHGGIGEEVCPRDLDPALGAVGTHDPELDRERAHGVDALPLDRRDEARAIVLVDQTDPRHADELVGRAAEDPRRRGARVDDGTGGVGEQDPLGALLDQRAKPRLLRACSARRSQSRSSRSIAGTRRASLSLRT